MGLEHAFDVLSRVVEQVERRGQSVRDVEAATDSNAAGALEVSMTIPVSLCAASNGTLDSSFTLERASLSENGGVTVTLSATDLLPELSTVETVVDIDEQAVHVDDGTLIMAVGFRIDSASSAAATTTTDGVAPDDEQSRDASGADTEETAGGDTEATSGDSETLAARLLAARADDVPADDVAPGQAQSRDETGKEAGAADDSGDSGLATRLASARSDDLPAYEDTDYLRLLYESCNTFTEMSDRIEMDVAAETVRRYMIEADIHSPNSYDTATHRDDDPEETTEDRSSVTDDSVTGDSETAFENAGSDPSPTATEDIPEEQFVTDGIGLPEGVAVEDIVNAVVDATAVYEVQRSLELGHGETRGLLRQLNILDLVLHRIDDRQHEVSKNDVVQRIRQCDAGAV